MRSAVPTSYFGYESYWETVVSIGWVPLVLAALGFSAASRRRQAIAWGVLVVVSVLFAAGWRFGLFVAFYEIVPGMSRFRVPARALFLATLAGAMLVGLGVEVIEKEGVSSLLLATPSRTWVFGMTRRSWLAGQIVAWVGPTQWRPLLRQMPRSLSPRPTGTDRVSEKELSRWARGCASDRCKTQSVWTMLGGTTAALMCTRRQRRSPQQRTRNGIRACPRWSAWSLSSHALRVIPTCRRRADSCGTTRLRR